MTRPQGLPRGGNNGKPRKADATHGAARRRAPVHADAAPKIDGDADHVGSGRLLELEHEVALRLANAESVPAALKSVIRAVCGTLGWDCGRLLRVDEAAGVLRFF